MLGVNDYYVGLPLGDINSKDNTTIYGSLDLIANYLTTNYSDSFIFFMTPFKIYCYDKNNTQNYKLEAVSNAIKYVAGKYNIPVLDIFEEGNYEAEMYLDKSDGIHPSQQFFIEYTVPQITDFIKENYGEIDYTPKEEIDFSELKFTAFGDSITYGADLIIGGRVENPYPTVLSNILGLESYENRGVSGATLTTNNQGLTCMTNIITSYTSQTDIIGVLGGVNDFNRKLPLGDIDDNDTSTVYGALHVGMSYLSENYSDSFIFYMTPYKEDFSGNFWSTDNSAGYNLIDVSNAIKEVAAIYDIAVLDLLETGNFESIMYDDDCDGIHPNQAFITNVMAPQIAQFIKDNYK
jgi:lysophospholipase L1-like esterase